jgi:phage minor structural protein GP20
MARLKEMLKEMSVEITDEIEEKILKEFKETKDFDEQAKKLSELENALKEKDELLTGEKIAGAMKLSILKENPKDADVLEALISKEKLTLNDKGEITGLSEQLDTLKKEKSFLFETPKEKKIEATPAPKQSMDTDSLLNLLFL